MRLISIMVLILSKQYVTGELYFVTYRTRLDFLAVFTLIMSSKYTFERNIAKKYVTRTIPFMVLIELKNSSNPNNIFRTYHTQFEVLAELV